MKTFNVHCENTARYSAELTVEAEDLASACRTAIDASHTTDGWKSLDAEYPTYVTAIAEGDGVDPWRSVGIRSLSRDSVAVSRFRGCAREV